MTSHFDHSFVVLAYKESPYLVECLDSLLRQSASGEVLIATSTPSLFLEDLAKRFSVKLVVNPQGMAEQSTTQKAKSPISRDWNFALGCGSSRLVTLAHQDDLYLPDFRKCCLAKAKNAGDATLIFTRYRELFAGQIRKNNINLLVKDMLMCPYFLGTEEVRSRRLKRLLLSFGSPICCPAVTYDRQNIGSFSFSDDFKINLDWDAWVRLAEKAGSFVLVKEPLMLHRLHAQSETSTGLAEQVRQAEDLRMFEQLWPRAIARALVSLYSLSYFSNRLN